MEHSHRFQPGEVGIIFHMAQNQANKVVRFSRCSGRSPKVQETMVLRQFRRGTNSEINLAASSLWASVVLSLLQTIRGIAPACKTRSLAIMRYQSANGSCRPILTYGGKGCKKRGVKPEKHGIIYERGQKAKLLSGEPKLGFAPAKVDITMEGEKLSKESRVNYSKLVTVEHNVKVFFIGNVTPSDWEIVSEAVNRCWEEKIHHKKKHFK